MRTLSRWVLLGSVTGILFSSCLATKRYEKPNVSTEGIFRTDRSLDSVSIASVSWQKLFNDPILVRHIERGISNNYDMRTALQNVMIANARMKQAKNGYVPTIGLTIPQASTQKFSPNGQFGQFFNEWLSQYEVSANLSWEIDVWGRLTSAKKASMADFLSQQASSLAIQSQVITNIVKLYYELVSLDEKKKVTEASVQNRKESLEVTKALFESGQATAVAVLQTESQLYSAQLTLIDLNTQIEATENAFSLLLGSPLGAIERSQTFSQELSTLDPSVGLPMQLLAKRPDVQAAELNFRSAFELTNVARASCYPALKLTATAGLQSLSIDQWFSASSIFANIIGNLTMPLLNQRKYKTDVEVAKFNQQKALIAFEKTLATAGKEVSDYLRNYENQTKKLDVLQKQVSSLVKAQDFSDELLKSGSINYLEVISAKDNTLNAQLTLVETKLQQVNAIVGLYRALGGGY